MCLSANRRLREAQARVPESLISYCLRRDLLEQSGTNSFYRRRDSLASPV